MFHSIKGVKFTTTSKMGSGINQGDRNVSDDNLNLTTSYHRMKIRTDLFKNCDDWNFILRIFTTQSCSNNVNVELVILCKVQSFSSLICHILKCICGIVSPSLSLDTENKKNSVQNVSTNTTIIRECQILN